jgi:hypothetical protein
LSDRQRGRYPTGGPGGLDVRQGEEVYDQIAALCNCFALLGLRHKKRCSFAALF